MAGGRPPRAPRSVLVVVTVPGPQALVLRRRSPADFWQSVTGAIEPGETPQRTARRELAEELGLTAVDGLADTGLRFRFPILPAWRDRYGPDAHTNLEHVFCLRLDAPFSPRLAPGEHIEYAWLAPDQALARLTSETNRRALRHCLACAGDNG